MPKIHFREIQKADNPHIAEIIRNSLIEFNANKPGTVFYDTSTDFMFEYFENSELSKYYIVDFEGEIFGGAGIYPSNGLGSDTCELVRMYIKPDARGKRIAKDLLDKCMNKAKELGFNKMYLETMPELKAALRFYEKNGFQYLKAPMGSTGHDGCGLWMIKDL